MFHRICGGLSLAAGIVLSTGFASSLLIGVPEPPSHNPVRIGVHLLFCLWLVGNGYRMLRLTRAAA